MNLPLRGLILWHLACTTHSAVGGGFEDNPVLAAAASRRNQHMGKIKSNVKGVLNQRVRMGLFTVPLWVVGAVFLARKLRDRRRYA
jgi:hypothetical protein